MPTVYKKTLKCIGNNSWMSSPRLTFNLTCGKGVTELQNLASLRLSSFAESYQMQQKNFDSSPYGKGKYTELEAKEVISTANLPEKKHN